MFQVMKKSNYLVDGGEGEVVVEELSVLHEHEGVPAVQVGHVRVDDDGDEAGARQRAAAQGTESRSRNC